MTRSAAPWRYCPACGFSYVYRRRRRCPRCEAVLAYRDDFFVVPDPEGKAVWSFNGIDWECLSSGN